MFLEKKSRRENELLYKKRNELMHTGVYKHEGGKHWLEWKKEISSIEQSSNKQKLAHG